MTRPLEAVLPSGLARTVFRVRLRAAGAADLTLGGVAFHVRDTHYQLRGTVAHGFEDVFARLLTLADADTTFIDVGANVGIASLILARHAGCRVYAAEPVLGTYLDLGENILRNPGLRITPFNLGLSSRPGLLRITTARGAPINHVLPAGQASPYPVTEAAFVTFDDFFETFVRDGDRVLVKIDVERHELDVLQGANRFLARDRPIAVCCEHFSDANRAEIAAHLGRFGFAEIQPPPSLRIPVSPALDETNAYYANGAWRARA